MQVLFHSLRPIPVVLVSVARQRCLLHCPASFHPQGKVFHVVSTSHWAHPSFAWFFAKNFRGLASKFRVVLDSLVETWRECRNCEFDVFAVGDHHHSATSLTTSPQTRLLHCQCLTPGVLSPFSQVLSFLHAVNQHTQPGQLKHSRNPIPCPIHVLPHCKVHIPVAHAKRHLTTTLSHLGLSSLLPHATSTPRPPLSYSSARIVLVPHRLCPVAHPSCT